MITDLIDLSKLEPLIGIEKHLHERRYYAILLRPWGFQVLEEPELNCRKGVRERVYALTKYCIDTPNAVKQVQVFLGQLQYGGLKDAYAVTIQYVTATGRLPKPFHIKSFGSKCVSILDTGHEGRVCRGVVRGNKFITSMLVFTRADNLKEYLEAVRSNSLIPNFYGYQRFGSRRPNTHVIGKLLVLMNYGSVVHELIAMRYPLESGELGGYERLVAQFISKTRNTVYALKESLRRNLIEIFGSALQAYLFNKLLSKLLKYEGPNTCKARLLVPGCDFTLDNVDSKLRDYYREVFKEEGLTPKDLCNLKFFGVKLRSYYRDACIRVQDITWLILDEHIASQFVDKTGYTLLILFFRLPAGAYATTVLSELFKLLEPNPNLLPC